MLPGTIPLTDEHFKIFPEKTITTKHSRILDGLTAQNARQPRHRPQANPIPLQKARRRDDSLSRRPVLLYWAYCLESQLRSMLIL